MLHLSLDLFGLALSSVALFFVLKVKGTLKLTTLNKATFFLALDIGVEVIEDIIRWVKKIEFSPEGITLEFVTLALTSMALYYIVSAKNKGQVGPLNVASWCIGWVVLAEVLELVLGFTFGRGA